MELKRSAWYANWLWLIPALIGGGVTLLLMVILPPSRTIAGFGDFFFKISPLVLAVVAIALFPRRSAVSLALLLGCILFYMGVLDSVLFLRVDALARAQADGTAETAFASYYMFILFLNAFTVLFGVLAYRLGGAGSAQVLKLGGAGILILVSGLNDLTMWALYPWPEGRPEVFSWASHVAIFFGRPPTLPDMIGFLAVHLLLAVGLLCLPLQRWIDSLRARRSLTPLPDLSRDSDEPHAR